MKKFLPILVIASLAICTTSMAADVGKIQTHDEIVYKPQSLSFTENVNLTVIHDYNFTADFVLNASVPVSTVKFAVLPSQYVIAEDWTSFKYILKIGKPDTKRHCKWLAKIIKLC